MIEFVQSTYEEVKPLREKMLQGITSPIDDMWEEGIIPKCRFFSIKDSKPLGFFALDDENTLLQFFLEDSKKSSEIFRSLIEKMNIKRALVWSADALFYSESLKLQKKSSVDTIFYEEGEKVTILPPFMDISYRIATMKDLDMMCDFNNEKVEFSGEWIIGYFKSLIERKGLIIFEIRGTILGFGEIRKSPYNEGYANIGVAVSKTYRKYGMGSYIIFKIRELCNSEGYKTICSTTSNNVPSQKTLEKCGYVPSSKIFSVIF